MDRAKKENQLKAVQQAFFDKPLTMKEVDIKTGVMRENICRYCSTLIANDILFKVGKRVCSITKHLANTYSSNPQFKPETNQLNLFDHEST